VEEHLDYAVLPEVGPTYGVPPQKGTAMRGSAMVQGPGMVLSDQYHQVVQAVNKLGLAGARMVRGGRKRLGRIPCPIRRLWAVKRVSEGTSTTPK